MNEIPNWQDNSAYTFRGLFWALVLEAIPIGIVLVIVLALAGCAPAPAPTPDIAGTALAIVQAERPTPQPAPTAQPTATPSGLRFTMFEDDDVQAFAGDADVSGEFRARDGLLQGFYKDGLVTIWAEQPTDKLSDDNGVIYLVPNRVVDLPFFVGGAGSKVAGMATVKGRGDNFEVGRAYWLPPSQNPTGRYAIVVEVDGRPIQNGHPWSWYYGLSLHVTIPTP